MFLLLTMVVSDANSGRDEMRMFATMIAAVALAFIVPISGANAQYATVGAPGGPTYCYGNGCPGQRHVAPRQNLRMPLPQQHVGRPGVVILRAPQPQMMRGQTSTFIATHQYRGGMLPVERPIGVPTVTGPTATPTGEPYVAPEREIAVEENGIAYTGKSCNRKEGVLGREGYDALGHLGCWKF